MSCNLEVYSRVTGFFRPTKVWNKGKQGEFKNRKTYNLEGDNNGGTTGNCELDSKKRN